MGCFFKQPFFITDHHEFNSQLLDGVSELKIA